MPTVEQRLVALENMLKNNTMGSMLKWRAANLNIAEWSDVSKDIGHITAGDMELGQAVGRRIVFSDIDHGMIDYDEHNRPYKRETYTTDYFRLGLAEHPGIDYNGVTEEVEIDGRCILPGTIHIDAFALGIISDTSIRVGYGTDDSDWTGFIINPSMAGGVLDGELEAGFDIGTGRFGTWGTEQVFEYATMYDGNIEMGTLGGTTGLILNAYGTEGSETGAIGLESSSKISAVSGGVQIYTPDGSYGQTLYLGSDADSVFAELGPATLDIRSFNREFALSANVSGGGTTSIQVTKTGGGPDSPGLVISIGNGGIHLDGVRNTLWGYPVNFYDSTYPTARATIPAEGDLRWDHANTRLEYYDGAAYQYINCTAV